MIGALFDRRVVVVHNGVTGKDRLDRPVYGETGRDVDVPARIEMTGSAEGTEYVSGKWVGYLASGTVLGPKDLILDGPRTFAVEGLADDRGIPGFPALDHVLVHLTTTGA